jgi:hypothetical protein
MFRWTEVLDAGLHGAWGLYIASEGAPADPRLPGDERSLKTILADGV